MSEHLDLDALLGELSRPAQAGELAGESATIDAMASAFHAARGGTVPITGGRRAGRVAAFVAAGVLGFGGVAAAGPGSFSAPIDPELVAAATTTTTTEVPDGEEDGEPAPSTSAPSTTDAPETTEAQQAASSTTLAPAGELVDDPDTEFDETQCAEGNHGQTVSSVAHEAESSDEVRAAAHSSCGKDKDKGDKDEADEGEAELEDDERGNRGNRGGNGNGNANGKGKGKGNSGD